MDEGKKAPAKRRRSVHLHCMVTKEERELIRRKMSSAGSANMGAYLRKMAIDGMVIELDLPSLGEIVRLLRINSNNLNQIAKRANETRNIYKADVVDLQKRTDEMVKEIRELLNELSELQGG